MFLTIFGAILAARLADWLIVAAVKTWYLPITNFLKYVKNFNK